jgi:hypothetical protein
MAKMKKEKPLPPRGRTVRVGNYSAYIEARPPDRPMLATTYIAKITRVVRFDSPPVDVEPPIEEYWGESAGEAIKEAATAIEEWFRQRPDFTDAEPR